MNSLLWEITGKGIKKPGYLYGSIHIQDKRVFSFDDTVTEIFNSCEAYAMEVVLDEINPLEVQDVFQMKRYTLKSLLDEKVYLKLEHFLQDKFNTPISVFEKTKPMFVSSQIVGIYEQKNMPVALDIYFLNLARQQNKKVVGLETFNEQLNTVRRISLKEQCKMLIEVIKDPENIENKYDELLQAYLKPDFYKIYRLTVQKNLPLNFNKVFLYERNRRMARRITKYIKKYSTFNAIGAGHLVGKNGVINLLKQKGIILKPVYFKFNNLQLET